MTDQRITTAEKALKLNLDSSIYGTIAEIGAGQEVAQLFFKAGGASGTVAKSMSAYDMVVSDQIYGPVKRYVSRERLEGMFEHEYSLLIDRLDSQRGATTRFFAFADTVAARNFQGTNECHGWMGIRFQVTPQGEPNEIVLHVRMLDTANVLQQEALGIFGVNLIYGAFHYHEDPERLIASLADNIGTDRIEVEVTNFSGPAFEQVDQRSLNLALLEKNFSNATMFGPDGTVKLPSEELHKRPVVLLRGSFRPITLANVDMLDAGTAQFVEEANLGGEKPLVIIEMTIRNLLSHNLFGRETLLALVDTLLALGHNVLITDYQEYYRLSSYLRRYTGLPIAILLGANNLYYLFDEQYYVHLHGGILEGFGRLFREQVKLYVYPMANELFAKSLSEHEGADVVPSQGMKFVTVENIQVQRKYQGLFFYLWDSRLITSIDKYSPELAQLHSSFVRKLIRENNPEWKKYVPAAAIPIIEEQKIFTTSG